MLDESRLKEEIEKVSYWVYDYVRRSGAKGIVVGNSGGKDSAVVIAIATKAIGKENVVTVGMPCDSTKADLEDARLVAKTFEVPLIEVDLSEGYHLLKDGINNQLINSGIGEISEEGDINIRPRMRMTVLYAIAQSLNYLVIGTGNLCEAMVGYTTKWGDNAADFAPIANFTVEEVIQIGEILGVPSVVTNKAPNDGLGGVTDEEKLGVKYSQIAEYIETGKTNPEAMQVIEQKYLFSGHKRSPIPTFEVERENLLQKKFEE